MRKILRRKLNSLARRISSLVAPAYPIFAWISPTTRCNLRCWTCARTFDPNWKSMDMPDEIYQIVSKEILSRLIYVELTGTGEPFLAPIFYRILEDVLRLKIPFSITTNCTVLPEDELLRAIINARGTIMVSIDGTDKETLCNIRQGLNFNIFWQNLQHLSELVKETAHPDFNFRFNFVITRKNVWQMSDLVKLAHQLGVKSIFFSSFMVGLRKDDYVSESLFDEPDAVKPHLKEALMLARQYGIQISPPVFKSNPGRAIELDEQTYAQHKPSNREKIKQCPHPWWSVYIDADGTIMPCCVFGVPFGKLTEQPFKKIWNGPVYRYFRRIVNTPKMHEGCKNCALNVRI